MVPMAMIVHVHRRIDSSALEVSSDEARGRIEPRPSTDRAPAPAGVSALCGETEQRETKSIEQDARSRVGEKRHETKNADGGGGARGHVATYTLTRVGVRDRLRYGYRISRGSWPTVFAHNLSC